MSSQNESSNNPDLPTGYEGANIPTDFHIPALGIKDIDLAMVRLFGKDNRIMIGSRDPDNLERYEKPVPVVFASGERFAMRDPKTNPIRDKSGALILPIIAIRRTGINQAKVNDFGSASGQDTGDFVIKKRLSEKDPLWQNLINKLGLKNQDNVSSQKHYLSQVNRTGNKTGTLTTRRDFGINIDDGILGQTQKNIYEIITIPFPMRYMLTYEMTIWTSFQSHMTEILEKIMTNYDGQARAYNLRLDKGYYVVAYFDDEIQANDNLEEFTDEQRVHKYVFNIKVPTFLAANQNGGDMVPFRRYLSAPQVSFDITDGIFEQLPDEGAAPTGDPDDFLLDNLENLDNRGRPIERLKPYFKREIIKNPFTGDDEVSLVKVKQRNARVGETVLSARELAKFEIP